MIRLIGLTGKARSGKDTVGSYLAEEHGYRTYAMASPIKEACRVMFGWDDRHLHGDLKEVIDPVYGVTPREAMQKLGTEFGRGMINTKLWELRAGQEILKASNHLVVVTDIRFDNEAELIKKLGGVVINIERPNRDEIKGVKAHQSEKGIKPELIDYNINNNDTLETLYSDTDFILRQRAA